MVRFARWDSTLLCCISISVFGSTATAAPPQALNKTLELSWNMFTPADCADGTTNKVARNTNLQIYISSQGRFFVKWALRAGSASRDKEVAPSNASNFSFAGDKIVGILPQVSGAVRQVITFDPSYQSCSVEMITGTEAAKPYTWINLLGVKCTATGKTVISGGSCSVHQGNSFAN